MKKLAWCAVAEPKLLEWAQAVASREIDAETAAKELEKLVGRFRFEADFGAFAKDRPVPKGCDPGLWRLLEFERAYPRSSPLWRIWQPTGRSTVDQIRAELGIKSSGYAEPWEWQPNLPQ